MGLFNLDKIKEEFSEEILNIKEILQTGNEVIIESQGASDKETRHNFRRIETLLVDFKDFNENMGKLIVVTKDNQNGMKEVFEGLNLINRNITNGFNAIASTLNILSASKCNHSPIQEQPESKEVKPQPETL